MTKAILLLATVLSLACSGGCKSVGGSGQGGNSSTPVVNGKTACGLSPFQVYNIVSTCRADAQAKCYIDPSGNPDPKCPEVIACDRKVEEACKK